MTITVSPVGSVSGWADADDASCAAIAAAIIKLITIPIGNGRLDRAHFPLVGIRALDCLVEFAADQFQFAILSRPLRHDILLRACLLPQFFAKRIAHGENEQDDASPANQFVAMGKAIGDGNDRARLPNYRGYDLGALDPFLYRINGTIIGGQEQC